MKCTLKIATVVLMLGATVATAQTPTPTQAQLFIDWYRQMQSVETANPYAHAPPVFRGTADAPIGDESFAERFATMQVASANSPFPLFKAPPTPTRVAADPVGSESFAERFREMQAASSDSGQFGFRPGSNDLASESPTSLEVAMPLRSVSRR